MTTYGYMCIVLCKTGPAILLTAKKMQNRLFLRIETKIKEMVLCYFRDISKL